MNTLIAEENNLIEVKDHIISKLQELSYDMEDMLEDFEGTHNINYEIHACEYNQLRQQLLNVVSQIACIDVQKEIIRTLVEKGLTEQAALTIAKESAPK